MMGKIILNFDESGNMGKKGRYFTIACVECDNTKPLKNVMKKAILKTKKEFARYEDCDEIKASESYPLIKDYFLRKISSKKNVDIKYIVADLNHVRNDLKEDENLLYNYMLQFLIVPVAKRSDISEIQINLDKRTIKVNSVNSFRDYMKLKLIDMNIDVRLEVKYVESHCSYCIQAADFIANAVNSYYEYGHKHCYDIIEKNVTHREKFPRHFFGL